MRVKLEQSPSILCCKNDVVKVIDIVIDVNVIDVVDDDDSLRYRDL